MKKTKDGNLIWEPCDIEAIDIRFGACKPLSIAEYAQNITLLPPIKDGTIYWLRDVIYEERNNGDLENCGKGAYAVEPSGNVIEVDHNRLLSPYSMRPMLSFWGKGELPMPADKVIIGGETWTVIMGNMMVCDRSVGEVPFFKENNAARFRLNFNDLCSDLQSSMTHFHNVLVSKWLEESRLLRSDKESTQKGEGR